MTTFSVNVPEHFEDWLRSVVRDAFDAIERHEGTTYSSMDDLADFINQTGEKLKAERERSNPA